MNGKTILLVSRHDYRTGWRAGRHFLADAFRAQGHSVQFFSVGFSPLSLLSNDHRKSLFGASNKWQEVDGIGCYLWRSPLHPFGKGLGNHAALTNGMFRWWIGSKCNALDEASRQADLIVVESGIAAALIGRIRRSTPNAQIIYFVADLLETISAHSFIAEQLYRDRAAISDIVVVARAMAPHFEGFGCPVHFVPHGVSKSDFDHIGPSPYETSGNIATVGSMLFDPAFFDIAAPAFPDMHFHLIGTPELGRSFDNVTEYGRMPFKDTLPFLKHADTGVAPYADRDGADYLADSSLKLMQYEFLRLPAVCPQYAVGDKANRHGYKPGDPVSIKDAVGQALNTPFADEASKVLDWKDVADRLLALDRAAALIKS
ncbi:hypothetical protein ABVF61_14560 [Roseibium sp. HPY-6]|uniref:GumK N-terminal domain-containing glycosyltransferase n=1 Tax=Roseibium sp. HPY-6 TaxID=3229852 RepID=UPI00338F9258